MGLALVVFVPGCDVMGMRWGSWCAFQHVPSHRDGEGAAVPQSNSFISSLFGVLGRNSPPDFAFCLYTQYSGGQDLNLRI